MDKPASRFRMVVAEKRRWQSKHAHQHVSHVPPLGFKYMSLLRRLLKRAVSDQAKS